MVTEYVSLKSVTLLVGNLATFFSEAIKDKTSRVKGKLEVRFKKGFQRFISENVARFSHVKTIISSSTPIPIMDLYVNLRVSKDQKAHRDDDFLTQMARYRCVIFTATAGSGKSMLMRYLYLRFLETQSDRLPIFLELRELNQHPSRSLLAHLKTKIGDYIDGFTDQQLRYALEKGLIILFLDGFDELDYDKRKRRETEIIDLAGRFSEAWVFLSSRPAESFSNWQQFHVFELQPFAKSQVRLLITKIPYDAETKNLFFRKLSGDLYETHREFLTNPLLTIMMLVTLEHFAEIPAKVHLFYEHAFEALFARHDVTKGGFQRKRHTSLALDDFKRLFSYFCMITYMRKTVSFSNDEVVSIIHQSIRSSQIQVDKALVRNDLVESTCMLIRDGLDFTFSHRSFQEYFTAYFLARVRVDELAKVLPAILNRTVFDNVVSMVAEMNRERFEEAWALPELNRLHDRVKGIDPKKNCVGYWSKIFGGKPYLAITGPDDDLTPLFETPDTDNDLGDARFALYSIYGVFEDIHRRLNTTREVDNGLLRKLIAGELLIDDNRFADLRDKRWHEYAGPIHIHLKPKDSSWLRDTFFGNFAVIEGELLPMLREEVARRVAERRSGLEAIFPDLAK